MSVPYIRLYLLGAPRLTRDGVPAKFARRKTLLLLALLALNPKGLSRDRLAACLCGNVSDQMAMQSLRVVLAELNKVLGSSALTLTRNHVELAQHSSLWVDALEFQSLAEVERAPYQWQSAVDLYQGDLLSEVDDDWVLPLRTRLATVQVQTLLRLAEHHCAMAAYGSAIALGRRALLLDASEEVAHRLIMRCYEAMGERTSALAQFEACAHALRTLFGVEPSVQTRTLQARLKSAPARADSLLAYPTNLPPQSSSFFNRNSVQRALESTLQPLEATTPPARLLTLTGMGGSGKSWLAQSSAAELVGSYPGGVWWVDVAQIAEAGQLCNRLLKVCGLQDDVAGAGAGGSAIVHLVQGLRDRQECLLLLDNCDAMVDAVATLAQQLLVACPRVQLLVTSCEALGLDAECLYHVPLLGVAEPGASAAGEAELFFAHCARRQLPGFELDANTLKPVRAVCRMLDGLPLALKLATERVPDHTLYELADRLAAGLEVLATEDHTMPSRHSSLWARMHAIHRLLDADEQTLLRCLAVKAPRCTVEQAEVLGVELGLRLSHSVFEVMAQLVNKSILVHCETPESHFYTLPTTLRRFVLQTAGGAGIVGPPGNMPGPLPEG